MPDESSPFDERTLMRDLAGGSTDALAAIYDRTAPVLYPLALRIVGSRERAALVLEDVFDELWRDRAMWQGAYSIPIVELIARCRDLSLAHAEPGGAGAGSAAGAGAGAADFDGITTLGKDLGPFISRQAAVEALELLPARDRLMLEEAYFRGTNARDIAVLLGEPTTDVAAALRAALGRFRDHADRASALKASDEHGAEIPSSEAGRMIAGTEEGA